MSNTKLIDCSKIKSLNYKRTSERTKDNAQWENVVDVQLDIGDTINVENAILNVVGISADQTVELLGEDDKDTNLCDTKVGIRTIPYICDNGENSVALPFCGFKFEPLFYDQDNTAAGAGNNNEFKPKLIKGSPCYDTFDLNPTQPFSEFYPCLNFYEGQTIIFNKAQYTLQAVNNYPNLNRGIYNFGAMMIDETTFSFSFYRTDELVEVDQIHSPFKYELYTNFSEFPYIGNFQYNSGLKYTIIDKDWNGPFRANWDGDFRSAEDDFKPEYLDIKLDLGGPQYESPSTICNILNDQLNNSNPYYSNPSDLAEGITEYYNVNKLPQITGTLSKTKMVNGRRKTGVNSNTIGDDADTSHKKLWGNLAVRDFNEWFMVNKLMRCSLIKAVLPNGGGTLEGLIYVGIDLNAYKSFQIMRPVWHIAGNVMRVNDSLNNGQEDNFVNRSFFPRIGVNIETSNYISKDKYLDPLADNSANAQIYQKIYYTCLPECFVMLINIEYTEENIKRLSESFRLNEIYDGTFTDKTQYNGDVKNWRIHFDNGESQQGDPTLYKDGLAAQKNFAFNQGAFNYKPNDDADPYGNQYQGYAYGFASHQFTMDDFIPNLENAHSCPKSDVPDVGATRFNLSGIRNSLEVQTGKTLISGTDDPPVFFKNNKHKDCRPAFFSRYRNDWKTLFKTSNVPDNIEFAAGSPFYEGLGAYRDDTVKISTDDDDSLAQKYNVGVYPFLVEMNPQVSHNLCGLLLYRDSATWDETNKKFVVSSDFALPCMYHGQFSVSTSFIDHPAVWLVNGRKYNETTTIDQSILADPATAGALEEENISEIVIGANNPTISFDNNLSKCVFSNLHNVKKLGLFDMAVDAANSNTALTYTLSNIGDEVVKINNTNVKYPLVWDLFTNVKNYSVSAGTSVTDPMDVDQITKPPAGRSWNLIHSTGGIFLDSFFGESILSNAQSLDDMTKYTDETFIGSLLNKLGFEFTDLIPPFGNQTNLYDSSKVHTKDPQKMQELVKPITTNPLIDISDIPDLAVSDFTAGESYDKEKPGDTKFGGLPVYDMSIGTIAQINLDGSNSEQIVASNLPTKLTSPYFLVYSNIGNGDYIQNRDSLQVVGIILKNYISGDFIYSFASQGFTVLSPMKLTSIKIVIRDNSGRIVSLNENNSIIFKITKKAFESIIDVPEPLNNPPSPTRKKK